MPRKPISFELDFMIKDIFPRFTVKQFDDVSFNIKPKNQGLDYNTTGMIGKIFVGVNNDMFMQTTGITVSNNNINILLDKNMLQKSGRAYAEVELTDNAGTITSSSFIFDIDPKIGEGGMIPGEYEGFVEKYERLISEFKSQVNSCVNNANTLVNKTINNCNTNVDNKLNTVDGLINTKVLDFEKRFNSLTSKQQQDSEVIDARAGAVSLKARLDNFDSQLEHIANKGTTIEVLERVTKEEIDRQVADGTIANLTIANESIDSNKLKKDSVKFEHCDFLDGFINYENLHKKYTTGVAQGGGNVIVGDVTAVSSIINVIPNKSYKVTVTGSHDRFRICGLNTTNGEITSTVPYEKSYISTDTLNTFTITDVGNVNTIVVSVSYSGQNPNLEVYLNEECDVDFKFPVKADIVKDGVMIDGSGIKEHTINGANAIADKTIDYTKLDFISHNKNIFEKEFITKYNIIWNGSMTSESLGVIAVCKIKPNTQYTITCFENHNRFRVCGLNADSYTLPINKFDTYIYNNDSQSTAPYTFTTNSTNKLLFIYVDNNNTYPKIQVEEGTESTQYVESGKIIFNREYNDLTDIEQVKKIIELQTQQIQDDINKLYRNISVDIMPKSSTNMKIDDIYSLYDEFLKYNCVTKELLGNEITGLPIYLYKFVPPKMVDSTGSVPQLLDTYSTIKRPKILLTTGLHGDEKGRVWALYQFMKDIYENWKTSKMKERLRFEVDFYIVPIVNPNGYNNNSRYASDGISNVVDLNRDFPASDDIIPENPHNAGNRGGLDNLNSQYLAKLVKENDDIYYVIDMHNMPASTNEKLTWLWTENENARTHYTNSVNKISKVWQNRYNYLNQDEGFSFGSIATYEDRCCFARYADKRGYNSCLLEFPTALSGRTTYDKDCLTMDCEFIGNVLYSIIDEYRIN